MIETQFELVLDGLVRSAALLVALIVILTYVGSTLGHRHPVLQRLVYGLGLGLFSAGCMLWPISRESGYLLDARVVPIVLSAPFFGLPAGCLAFLIAAATRVHLGGQGALAGVSVVALAFCGSAIVALARGWRLTLRSEAAVPVSLSVAGALAAWATASMAVPLLATGLRSSEAPAPFLVGTGRPFWSGPGLSWRSFRC